MTNYFFIFQNFVPLLRLDGYWILSDAIDEADLRGASFRFLRHDLCARLRDRARVRPQEWLLVGFAVVAPLYAVLAFLLALGSPFLRLQQGVPGAETMSPGLESREAYLALQNEFPAGETRPITILLDLPASATDAASIDAVVNPDTTDALYFVARGDGSSEFSSNLDAHNRAVNKFQRHQ